MQPHSNFQYKTINGIRMRFLYNVTKQNLEHFKRAVKKINEKLGETHIVIDEDISGNPNYCNGLWCLDKPTNLSPFWRDVENRIDINSSYEPFTAPKGFGIEPIKEIKRIPRKLKKRLNKAYPQMGYEFLTLNNKMCFVRYMKHPTYSNFLVKHICELKN